MWREKEKTSAVHTRRAKITSKIRFNFINLNLLVNLRHIFHLACIHCALCYSQDVFIAKKTNEAVAVIEANFCSTNNHRRFSRCTVSNKYR